MHKWVKKDFWKKGASEILSFIVLAPVMLILFALLASIVQSESLKEKLEYTTYVAARAAALSESLQPHRQMPNRPLKLTWLLMAQIMTQTA